MRVLLTEIYSRRPFLLEVQDVNYDRADLILTIRSSFYEFAIDGIAEPFALGAMEELYREGKTDLTYYEASPRRYVEDLN